MCVKPMFKSYGQAMGFWWHAYQSVAADAAYMCMCGARRAGDQGAHRSVEVYGGERTQRRGAIDEVEADVVQWSAVAREGGGIAYTAVRCRGSNKVEDCGHL